MDIDDDGAKKDNEEEEEEEDEEEPVAPKKAVSIPFSDDDFDKDDVDDALPLSVTKNGAGNSVPSLVFNTDDTSGVLGLETGDNALANGRSQPATALTTDGMVVWKGPCELDTVVCTYASNPSTDRFSPLVLNYVNPQQDDKEAHSAPSAALFIDGSKVDEQNIMSMPWGVFTIFGAAAIGGKRRANIADMLEEHITRKRGTDAAPPSEPVDPVPTNDNNTIAGVCKLADSPWFILVAPESRMSVIASPFFLSRVRVVQVAASHVQFSWRPQVPIFYVTGIDQKLPMWPVTQPWVPLDLKHLYADTLYSHVEFTCKNDGKLLAKTLEHVLKSIDSFPMSLSQPHEVFLKASMVPINNYSTRQDRIQYFMPLITSLKDHASKVASTNYSGMMTKMVDCTPIRGDVRFITSSHYIFANLEKPYDCFDKLNERGCFPIEAISGISSWRAESRADLAVVFENLYTLADAIHESRTCSPDRLRRVFRVLRLDVTWFASWYYSVHGKTNLDIEAVNNMYALFAASTLWSEALSLVERFGHVSTYLLSKARREMLLDSRFILESEEEQLLIRVDKTSTHQSTGPVVLLENLEVRIINEFDHLNSMDKTSPFTLYGFEKVSPEHPEKARNVAAVNRKRFDVSKRLSEFVLSQTFFFVDICKHSDTLKAMGPKLPKIPPLVVQSSYVYGAKSGNTAQIFSKHFRDVLKGTSIVSFPAMTRSQEMTAAVKSYKDTKPQMIIFEDFHKWSLDLIDVFLTQCQMFKLTERCSHLVFLGLAHSLGALDGGGSMMWELSNMADRLNVIIHAPVEASTKVLMPPTRNEWQRNWMHGTYSENEFPPESREEQLESNEKLFVFSKSGRMNNVLSEISRNVTDLKFRYVVIMYARFTTMRNIQNHINEHGDIQLRTNGKLLKYIAYRDLESRQDLLRQVDAVVLSDLEYEGAARATFLHINTVIEYAQQSIYVITDTQRHTSPKETLTRVYMQSDAKSDRLLQIPTRCPLMTELFDARVDNHRIYNHLSAHRFAEH
jgi:hypothetical protein